MKRVTSADAGIIKDPDNNESEGGSQAESVDAPTISGAHRHRHHLAWECNLNEIPSDWLWWGIEPIWDLQLFVFDEFEIFVSNFWGF